MVSNWVLAKGLWSSTTQLQMDHFHQMGVSNALDHKNLNLNSLKLNTRNQEPIIIGPYSTPNVKSQ
jgi:hypothetical protein